MQVLFVCFLIQELFIATLAREAQESRSANGEKKEINYSHLGKKVHRF